MRKVPKLSYQAPDGDPAIIWAAKRGHMEILEHLLANGVDLLACNKEGYTAIDSAIIHGHYEIALLLKRHVYYHAYSRVWHSNRKSSMS